MKTSKHLGTITILFFMLGMLQIGTAAADGIFTLTVNFPGISSVHTYVKQSDGILGTAAGQLVASQTYKNDQAVFTNLPSGIYDLAIVRGAKTLIVDNVTIDSDTVVGNLIATMTVSFPGIYNVHTYVKTTADGDVDNRTYQNNITSLVVLKSDYKVVVVKGAQKNTYDVNCNTDTCALNGIVATMTVNFPGISSVHTYVKTTAGGDVDNRTYQNSTISLAVLKATYKVTVVKGAKQNIYDVDCSTGDCTLKDIVSTLTVNFPGISSVHTYVNANDGVADSFSGGTVDNNTYKNDSTSLILLKGIYDVKVVKGAQNNIYDVVDCTAETCSLTDIVSALTVDFLGVSNVHTYVRTDDGIASSVSGGSVDNRTYQTDSTMLVLLKGFYDVRVIKGAVTDIYDAVDCTGLTCHLPPFIYINQSPELGANQSDVSVNEGQTANNSGTVIDADEDAVTLSTSIGTITNNENGTWSWSFVSSDGPADSQMVIIYADDSNGGTAEISFQLTVDNVAPNVTITAPMDGALYTVNTPVNLMTSYTDPGSADTHMYSIDWDDLSTDSGAASNEVINGSHTYVVPGVYTIAVTVTDDDGGFDTEHIMVVVYDPTGGFVTGGGWFISSEGAFKANETLTGKATFGFVAKYKKGATIPDGNTEFQFKAGGLNFHSTSYEWLVVAGNKAQFKGEGTINGQGSYKFMIWADDDNPDTFRIQIWGDTGIIYDNSSKQSLGGGNIVVHQ